ncbi:MAG: hypothetical protein WCQ00_01610 [bacterium]
MSIEFDEQGGESSKNSRLLYAKFQKTIQPPAIILFLIRKHIVKDEKRARILLLVLVLLIFFISAYLFIKGLGGPVFIDRVNKYK